MSAQHPILIFGSLLVAGVVVVVGSTLSAEPAATAPVAAAAGVHTITLPNLPPELPPGKGRDTVTTVCTFCHSNRYITMQPAFSREVWTAEVEKMRKTYGAPVSDQQVPEVVEYLMSIRGAPSPASAPAK